MKNAKNYLDTYYKNNCKEDVNFKLLPLPALKKACLKWIHIHRGSQICDLHDYLILNYKSWNKTVTPERIQTCLRDLKRERKIRIRKFSFVHNYAILYSVNHRKER